jgi:para-nitrobenzyl esterase
MVLSGAMRNPSPSADEDSRKGAKAILDELGITKDNIEKIYEVSFDELVAAYRKAAEKGTYINWSPVANDYFRGFPGAVGFMPWSKDKPIIYGSVLGEFPQVKLTVEEKEAMTEDDKIAYLRERYGEEADRLMELFREAYPKHDILDLAYMDSMVRIPTLEAAMKHAESGNNNTYVFIASYNAPEDGWIPLWHGGEVCYIFMNEDRVYVLNEAIYGQKLANIFSTMTLNFAKYGNPNNKYLPKWEPFTTDKQYTMIIDRECECRDAFDKELVELHSKVSPIPSFFRP